MSTCRFCNIEWLGPSLVHHENNCKNNPNAWTEGRRKKVSEAVTAAVKAKGVVKRATVQCDKCLQAVSKSNIAKHMAACSGPKKLLKKIEPCKFCNKIPRKPDTHADICRKNPNNKKTKIWTDEDRLKHSAIMKKVVEANPDSYSKNNVCGRVKIEEYNGESFHGKWEVMFAKWLDENGISWARKVEPLKYEWNGKWHLYFPDFYLPEMDVYVEVKGYETERDRCKWKAVPNLIVIKQVDINKIKAGTFSL